MKYYSILEPENCQGLQALFPGAVINQIEKPVRSTGLVASDSGMEIHSTKTFILIENEHTPEQMAELDARGAYHSTDAEAFNQWQGDMQEYSHRKESASIVEQVTLTTGEVATVEVMGLKTDYLAQRIEFDTKATYQDATGKEVKMIADNTTRIPVDESGNTIGEYDYLISRIEAGENITAIQKEIIQFRATAEGGARFEK
jgi:hypothetical protein